MTDRDGAAVRIGATVLERWLELSELLDRAARARVLVLADELLAVVHRLDLSGEEPVRLGARVAILAARGVAVLFRAADVLPHRHVLGGLAERDRVIAEVDHPRIGEAPSECRVREDALAAGEGLGRFQRHERR